MLTWRGWVWYHGWEVRIMKKFVDRLFQSPYYMREVIFAGKYAALLQLIAALCFCAWSRVGGPMGSMECAEVLLECGWVTMALTFCIEMIDRGCQKMKSDLK